MILSKHPLDAAPRRAQVCLVRSSPWRGNDGVGCTVVSVQDLKPPKAGPLSQQQTPSTGAIRTGGRSRLRNASTEVKLSGSCGKRSWRDCWRASDHDTYKPILQHLRHLRRCRCRTSAEDVSLKRLYRSRPPTSRYALTLSRFSSKPASV